MSKVWVVCDDADFVHRLRDAAGQLRLHMEAFSDLKTLTQTSSQEGPAIIFLDLDTSVISETQILHAASLFPHATLIALSRRAFHPELTQAFAQHIRVCLRKPVDMNELRFWLRSFTREASS